jgi:hypothetical protein
MGQIRREQHEGRSNHRAQDGGWRIHELAPGMSLDAVCQWIEEYTEDGWVGRRPLNRAAFDPDHDPVERRESGTP